MSESDGRSILFFMVTFDKGGAEWVITNLISVMVKERIKVGLLSVKDGSMFEELDSGIYRRHCSGSFISAIWLLIGLIMSNNYAIVFTTQRGAAVIASLCNAFCLKRKRFIVREAASNFQKSIDSKPFYMRGLWRSLYSFAYNSADLIIVNSKGTMKDLYSADILRREDQKVVQINNPVDVQKILERATKATTVSIDFSRKTIISVGRLTKKKNMDIVIKSMMHVKQRNSDAQLLIVGIGEEEANLRNLVTEIKLQDSVFFLGKQDNPYPLIKNSDVLVLASQWEGFGMVLVEALALDVPVVATDIECGPRDILCNGRWGELVAVGSVEGLANGIISSLGKERTGSLQRAMDFDKHSIVHDYMKHIF